jgi:DNA-binding HxlR family transcriptional regulator
MGGIDYPFCNCHNFFFMFLIRQGKITYLYFQKVSTIQKVSSNQLVSAKNNLLMASLTNTQIHSVEQCKANLMSIGDALYAIGGKWKLRIIVALMSGNKRFNELQRLIEGISAKVLSAELKELEINGFIQRQVFTGTPIVVDYQLTAYAGTLSDVLESLGKWGAMHRETVKKSMKTKKQVAP